MRQIEEQKYGFRGVPGLAPPENLNTVMTVFGVFSTISKANFVNFFAPNSESFTKYRYCMTHVVPTFSVYACLRRKDHCYQKDLFEIMEKLYSSKITLKMAGGVMHTQLPTSPPGFAPSYNS